MKNCVICAKQWLREGKSQMAAISKSARICETCGTPTEATSSGDFGCIVCLFDIGLGPDVVEGHGTFGETPERLGAYTIERHADGSVWELGHGAMGVTYRAIDKALDRPVALKIINTNLRSHSAEARERFMREARAAAALRHPNVATVYQFGVREETGQFFYAMELVEGETLEERVRRLGPLDVLTTIDVALQVTAALAAAEERGLVHRDLKPGNLMLVGDRDNGAATVKVIDFGVAKAISEKTNPMALTYGGFVGTPAFASPEQFANAPVDVRSDIYSLGATLWFALTGHMLFSGRSVEEIREAHRSIELPIEQLKAARVPRRFITLLRSMLAIEPAARPAGARQLAAKLQAIRASITGRRKAVQRFAVAAAVIALLTIVGIRVFRSRPATPVAPPILEKSIAVLPFEILSDDQGTAYFADGIQEEILTRLAKIADLRVISRTSTERYQAKPRDLGKIAKQLGVANILEGSVQKAAGQVRINVQLIDAQTDAHLWADTYDRNLTDILGVESEIAKGIAESLQAKLTGREEQALAIKPTTNPEAYDAYLRGMAFEARYYSSTNYFRDLLEKVAGFYERAVELDPNFAIAWTRLSRADAWIYFSPGVNTTSAARGDAAKRALEQAQKLEPNSPETQLALGYYQYQVLRNYELAKSTFGRVRKMLPGNSDVLWALAAVARREGHWDESIAYFEQALTLDPCNVNFLMDSAETYIMLRQFSAALKLHDRALDIKPNDPDLMATKANVYHAQGNLPEAAELLSGINEQTPSEDIFLVRIIQLKLERNYGEAVRLLQARQAQFHFDSQYNKGSLQVTLALMQRLAGDMAGAKVTAEQARDTLEQPYKDQSGNFEGRVTTRSPRQAAELSAQLSQAYAAMGEKDSALKLAQRAIMLLPCTKDKINGPSFEENLASIQAIFGENSRAISTLTQLLQTPYSGWLYSPAPITPALLRLDPIWDPLRSDPAFQKLCGEKQN
jgi:TolB-like protein/Tfp pilus assembly protein PilF